MLNQFCLNIRGKHENINVTADSAVENPVIEEVMEFNIFVSLIWFLLRVLTDDGDYEKPTRESVIGEEVDDDDVMIRLSD